MAATETQADLWVHVSGTFSPKVPGSSPGRPTRVTN
jgi:hypothetical protein